MDLIPSAADCNAAGDEIGSKSVAAEKQELKRKKHEEETHVSGNEITNHQAAE
eukprot:gene47201-63232_t